MQSEKFNIKELSALLKKQGLFIPATLVLSRLLSEKKAKKIRGGFRILSERSYEIDSKDAINCAKEISLSGYLLCESDTRNKNFMFPFLDQIFEELVELSEKQILIVTPFISIDFISDMKKVLEPKKSLISIITNSPQSSIVPKLYHRKAVATLLDWGFDVKITKKNFHAKIYLFDSNVAIIGSSNFSRNGFFNNYELGVILFGNKCNEIHDWVTALLS